MLQDPFKVSFCPHSLVVENSFRDVTVTPEVAEGMQKLYQRWPLSQGRQEPRSHPHLYTRGLRWCSLNNSESWIFTHFLDPSSGSKLMGPWQLLAVHAEPHIYQKRCVLSPTVPLTWRKQSLEHLVMLWNKKLCLTVTVAVLPELLLFNSPVEREADQQGPWAG